MIIDKLKALISKLIFLENCLFFILFFCTKLLSSPFYRLLIVYITYFIIFPNIKVRLELQDFFQFEKKSGLFLFKISCTLFRV